MKYAICPTEEDAKVLQAADDAAARLPWPGRYVDGRAAPVGHGVTLHRYGVTPKPDKSAYAFPVDDAASPKAKDGKAVPTSAVLDASWEAKPIDEKPKDAKP